MINELLQLDDHVRPSSAADWRGWLAANHDQCERVWLVLAKKNSGIPSLSVSEAIDEALCFGWIDSLPNKIDEKYYKLRFNPRNRKSNWSKVNKENVERLTARGKMESPGLKMIKLAKETGTWTALDDVDNLLIHDDLQKAFDSYPRAMTHWETFPRSIKRGILEWIYGAKRPATRAKRITETARLANDNIRANQYEKK